MQSLAAASQPMRACQAPQSVNGASAYVRSIAPVTKRLAGALICKELGSRRSWTCRVARVPSPASSGLNPPVPSSAQPHASMRTAAATAKAVSIKQEAIDSAATATAAEVEATPQVEQYPWTQAWYPVIPAAYLYEDRPYGFQLLGISMVVWRNAAGALQVLEDACPHRLAPLSEGYIQPATHDLMCSYHGWEFDGSGKCTKIPQIDDPKALSTACGSSRSCVRAFPAREAWGLLWVWPEAGPAAAERAAATDLNIPDVVKNAAPGALMYFSSEKAWSMRETPLEYELLVENILDLSHVPFSHHGVAGAREEALPITMLQVGETTCKGGLVMETSASDLGMQKRGFKSGLLYFAPPNRVHYEIENKDGSHTFLTSFTTPVAPGKSRYFSRIYTDNPSALPGWAFKILSRMPPWLVHLNAHEVVDADMLLASGQQAALAARGVSTRLERAFYMPAVADRAVVAFYKWLNQFSGGRVQYAVAGGGQQAGDAAAAASAAAAAFGARSPAAGREAILDRYTQHTRHCKFCQEGLATLDKAVLGGVVTAAVAGIAAVCVLKALNPLAWLLSSQAPGVVQTGSVGWAVVLALVAAAAVAVANVAHGMKRKFYRGNYTFHDRHLKPTKAQKKDSKAAK